MIQLYNYCDVSYFYDTKLFLLNQASTEVLEDRWMAAEERDFSCNDT